MLDMDRKGKSGSKELFCCFEEVEKQDDGYVTRECGASATWAMATRGMDNPTKPLCPIHAEWVRDNQGQYAVAPLEKFSSYDNQGT